MIRLNQNQLLWIQIRTNDRPIANRVLDSVRASGGRRDGRPSRMPDPA